MTRPTIPSDGEAPGSITSGELGIPVLDVDYLLVVNIPVFLAPDGGRYVEPLWAKDIREHLRYLPRLSIASPTIRANPPEGFERLPEGDRLRIVPLSPPRSRLLAAAFVAPDAIRLWTEIGRAAIVHYGVAGWPYPLGWLVGPIASIRGKKRVVIVESAPWRADLDARRPTPKRLLAALYESQAKRLVRSCEVPIFTHEEYRNSLLGNPARGWVIPASWIDEDTLLTEEEAGRDWDRRLSDPDAPLALGFAGRLVEQKGIPTLLEALRILDRRGVSVTVDLFGDGPLRDDCERRSGGLRGSTRLRVRGVLPYGPAFFEAIRSLHAVLVPSLGDEQPRILYDSWSQAVPVLGSDTPGLRDCLDGTPGGELVPPGDAPALADAIERKADDPASLRATGMAGLARARSLTHQEMHRRRRRIFAETFPGLAALDDPACGPVPVGRHQSAGRTGTGPE